MVSGGTSQASPLGDDVGSNFRRGNKIQTHSGVSHKNVATARGLKLPTSAASLFRHPTRSIVAAQEQRLRQLNALDLCDVKTSTSFRTTRSSNTIKHPTFGVALEAKGGQAGMTATDVFGNDVLIRNGEQELLARDCFQKAETPRTSAGGSYASENLDPFTSDEEGDFLRKATPFMSKIGKQPMPAQNTKDWPDTDDEFERSCPLNCGDTLDTDDSDDESFWHDTVAKTYSLPPLQGSAKYTADGHVLQTLTLVDVIDRIPPRLMCAASTGREAFPLACLQAAIS